MSPPKMQIRRFMKKKTNLTNVLPQPYTILERRTMRKGRENRERSEWEQSDESLNDESGERTVI